MDDNKNIQSLKKIPMYLECIKKLSLSDTQLSSDEKTFLLSCAVLLIRKYEADKRHTSYIELAYYIILKYALTFNDYEPLFDFSVNFGFYPIAQAISDNNLISFDSISFSLINNLIEHDYKYKNIIETFEQKQARNYILGTNTQGEISYIAPTSFGKSSIITEHIDTNSSKHKKVGIIVPTKSLLMQTYRAIKDAELGYKILIHDEMYNSEERFIAIFTQERALRLISKYGVSFDALYVDEAHRLFERNSRAVLLSRLIRICKKINDNLQLIYLSPLISDSNNLRVKSDQNIFEQRIVFNVKEPEYFEYRNDTSIYKYNRFVDEFYHIGNQSDMYNYILDNCTNKSFFYLFTPRKIEQFAKSLCDKCPDIQINESISEIIDNLSKYVHDEFYCIDYIKKGIIYLHGKMPDNVKEYLEYKFSKISELKYIVANKVILEGINLPIDSLFILSTNSMNAKDLANLIGRVNRLDQIFGVQSSNIHKLQPKIHFVNSIFNRQNGKMCNQIRLLKSSFSKDKIENPILNEFDLNQVNEKEIAKCREIINNEEFIFVDANNPIQNLKKKMIELGMTIIYTITDELSSKIYLNIQSILLNSERSDIHIMDIIKLLFINGNLDYIIDDEFLRLKDEQAINYYKMFLENRRRILKVNIASEVRYFQEKSKSRDPRLYIGESYGEIPYESARGYGKKVYVDLSTKTVKQLVNLAIVKQKMEEDFVSYKLSMFFQLMLDYEVISKDEYNLIMYGTTDSHKLHLVKMGLTMNIINKLEDDNQLRNITVDENNNLKGNSEILDYKLSVDDFYRFELNKFI